MSTAATSVIAMLMCSSGSPALAQPAVKETGTCKGDAGGITLSPGFCANVFADKLGHVRHLVVAPNGVVYANTWSGIYYHNDTPPPGGFLIALQDTNGDGKAEKITRFGSSMADGNHGGTGIAIYKDHVYAETNDSIVRYALTKDGSAPTGQPETVVSGCRWAATIRCIRSRSTLKAICTSTWFGNEFLPEREPDAQRARQPALHRTADARRHLAL